MRRDLTLAAGTTEIACDLERVPLPKGRYSVWFGAFEGSGADLVPWRPVTDVDVYGPDLDPSPNGVVRLAPVHVSTRWETG